MSSIILYLLIILLTAHYARGLLPVVLLPLTILKIFLYRSVGLIVPTMYNPQVLVGLLIMATLTSIVLTQNKNLQNNVNIKPPDNTQSQEKTSIKSSRNKLQEYCEKAPEDPECRDWKKNVTKGESLIWKNLKAYKNKTKTNGKTGKEREYYEWDYRHNDIEVYDFKGNHKGSADPNTGEIYKPPVQGRKINL